MSDNGASSIPPQTFVECGICKGNANISWFCKNCPTSLCDACATTHRTTKQYKSHTIVERTYTVLRLFGPAKIAEQCEVHSEKDISSYCNECDAPCCISCLVQNHQRHEISTIEDKYLDAERRLNVYYKQLDTDVRPTLEEMEDQTREDVKEDNFTVEIVINDINEFRKDFIQNFNRSCDDLITEVYQISKKTTEAFGGIEKSKKMIDSLKKEIEEKIERGRLDIIKYQPPKLEFLIPTIKRREKVDISFEPSMKILEVMKESVGKIKFKEIKREVMHRSTMLRSVHVQKLHSFDSNLGATSMTTAGNNMAWVMDSDSPTMYLYNDTGKVVRSVTVADGVSIRDMANTQSGNMIVTCRDNKVRRVSVNGEVSTMIDTAPFGCHGVCVTDKQEIIVCMNDQDDKNHVAVYSSDGRSKVREIRGRDGQGKHLITYPYRVVQNGQDLCVVDYGSNVVCVDEREYVRWAYDGKQAKLEKSFYPWGICVDKHNNLLVTDGNNDCVHYIDWEGGLIQVILTQEQTGLGHHWGICVDDVTGHIWVGNLHKKVVIAKYLK